MQPLGGATPSPLPPAGGRTAGRVLQPRPAPTGTTSTTTPIAVPPPQPAAERPGTVRALLREWVRAQLEGRSEVSIPALKAEAVAHFRGNQAFIDQLLAESVPRVVYDLVQATVAEGRQALREAQTRRVVSGDLVLDAHALDRRAAALGKRWARWYEHAGSRHVLLWDMKAPDLRLAIAERRERESREGTVAALWERLLAGLPDDTTTVGQVFTATEVEDLVAEIGGLAPPP